MSNYYSGQLKAANREWKVLVIDFDSICLMILEKMLRTCNYQVTTCQNAEEAINLLKENDFDMMMVEVYMPDDLDGLEFIKNICEHREIPVIAMSSDDDEEVIKEGFKAGACDYLVKPIRVESVRHVWMNVYRAQRHGLMKREHSWSSSVTNMINESKSGDYHKISDNNKSTSDDGEDSKCVNKRKLINNNNINQQINDYVNTSTKKQRIIWTPELHHKFVAAVNQFGNSKAVPKKILELMNVPGLSRENVASHLQKYRQYKKRVEQNCEQEKGHTMKFMPSKEECFQRHNIQAQVIATSSLQLRGYPYQNDHLYGRETLAHRKHVNNVNDVDHQMLSFHHAQPHQTIGQIANAADINLAIVEHVEGSNVIYHPLASYAYSKIDSKIHVVETPCNWSTFSMEDNLKKEASSSIGGQQCANYAYQNNVLDLGYNDASLYIQQLGHNSYGCT